MLIVRGQQPRARGLAAAAAPFAAVVELADDARRAHAFLPVVELFLDLVLDQLALLLDHQDFLQALGEAPRAVRLERPGHGHLVDPDTDVFTDLPGKTQRRKGLHHIPIRLAGRGDAESRARRIPHDAVEAVGAAVGEGGVDLVVEDARFLFEDGVGPADVQPAAGQDEVLRNLGSNAVWIYENRRT